MKTAQLTRAPNGAVPPDVADEDRPELSTGTWRVIAPATAAPATSQEHDEAA
jgi:hypothetical protein